MKGHEFIRRVKKYGKRRGIPVRINEERGKGSHVTLYFGNRLTIIKDRKKEIGTGLYRSMLNQLGIEDDI
ncbi:MAG: type II toxin-antitoxin system HicA family toxin [Gammaproteobacteria bacterium]